MTDERRAELLELMQRFLYDNLVTGCSVLDHHIAKVFVETVDLQLAAYTAGGDDMAQMFNQTDRS